MSPRPPPATVLREFGVGEAPRLMHGGRGTSWLAGDLVVEPEAGETYEWLAEALYEVALDEVRVAMPIRTRSGTWVSEGWSATRWVEGVEPDRSTPSTWIEIIEAGRALHRAVAHLSLESADVSVAAVARALLFRLATTNVSTATEN